METDLKQIDLYLSYKLLYINPRKNEIIFLGYNLNTTKTEYAILRALIENTKSPLPAEKLISLTSLDMSKENLAFHISNINNKAKIIGNRQLIKNIAKIGYFLNEEM